jgi:hypothetical protein
MNAMLRKALVCGVVGVCAAAPAVAGPWSDPSGTSNSFSYANGGDINGNFGDPFLSASEDTFYFINANFQVNAANGATDQQVDEVSFDVFANPGLQFKLIRVTANGSYAATGPGPNEVDLSAMLALTELGANEQYDGGAGDDGRMWTGNLDTAPSFPKSNAQGDWSGLATVDITFEFPIPDDSLHVSMANDVIAITGAGGSAQINVQYQDLKIELVVIPEPASLSLMGIGVLALLRRRR